MKSKIWLGISAAFAILIAAGIWYLDIPNWQKLDLDRLSAQPKSTVVYDADGAAIDTLSSGQKRIWKQISDIPEHVQQAFLAAEDQQFYSHAGINPKRMIAALLSNLRSRSYGQGASTITQQLIKLTHLSEEKTISRKLQEIVLALQLERKLSKDEILECYLNTVYFGKGAYGIEAAANAYFGKGVGELTLAESALLAGVIKAPSSYAPHLNAQKSIQRRNLVLDEMAECGYITGDEAANAQMEALALAESADAGRQYGWYLDAVLEEAAQLLVMTADEVLTAGLHIETGFQPAMQNAADALFSDASNFPANAADGTPVQAAFIALDPTSGEIVAMVGGREYAVQRGLNRATQMRRSPGSAIKPVSTYAAAIDAYGFSPTSMVEDTPRAFDGGYTPGNAGGNSYGTVTLREALSRSLNIATVDLAELIGMNAVRSYATRLGLDLSPDDVNLALSLGSMTDGVSPSNLCAAYAALANGGVQVESHLIRSIRSADGRQLYHADAPSQRAVKDSTAYMLTDMLKTAATTGSASALSACGMTVAGKTGTVSGDDGSTRDIWTAAYTPDLAIVSWMGFDTPDAAHALSGSTGGSGYPARLCAAFLENIRSELSGRGFPRPASVRTALVDAAALEEDRVMLATALTPQEYIVQELFHPNALPQSYTDEWSAPQAVNDLVLLTRSGEIPAIQFTALSDSADYLVLRTANGQTEAIATLHGNAGEVLRYADTEADLSHDARYTVLPRHRILYEHGTMLTGTESAAVTYTPGGIFNLLFGSDAPETTPAPPEIDVQSAQSLFG